MELSDESTLVARRALVDAPHVATLNDFVRRLRLTTDRPVPWFDPLDGGSDARLLVLMESPSRRGIGNGFVSADNPTPTGRRMRDEFARAGLVREDRVVWNVVPWYLGNDLKARNPTVAERREGAQRLADLLPLLPRLRVVLTLGAPAREGWRSLALDLPHVAAPHPSNTNLCARPWALAEFRQALTVAGAWLQ